MRKHESSVSFLPASRSVGDGFMIRKSRGLGGRSKSGQALILSALAVAVLITSTLSYVYELEREQALSVEDPPSDLILSIKQMSRNAVISSLTNISQSLDFEVLNTNLEKVSNACSCLNHEGISRLTFTVLNDSAYQSGTLISWNESSSGVTSSYVNFTLVVSDQASEASVEYAVNVTTRISLNASSMLYNGSRLFAVALSVFDESGPESLRNMTVSVFDGSVWVEISADSLVCLDHGDGSYGLSFFAGVLPEDVLASVRVTDSRGIVVTGNSICSGQPV